MERISRKTQLWYEGKSEEVYISSKIDDLKSRADTYFRVKATKFFLSYKGLIFIYEEPLPSMKGLNKIEANLEKQKLENNENFVKCLDSAIKEKTDVPLKVKVMNTKRKWGPKEDGKDSDSEEEEAKETSDEEEKSK